MTQPRLDEARPHREAIEILLRQTHPNIRAELLRRFDAALRVERERNEGLRSAAEIELGRHLCFTSEYEQRRFWKRVEDRAVLAEQEKEQQ